MPTESATKVIGNVTLDLHQGNIALCNVDAVVNAANEYLNLGSGVAGAIRELGGDIIQKECAEIGYCPVGSAVVTSGGNLRAKYVIHAVGPMYGEGNENEKLRDAVQSALKLGEQKGVESIAFPAISAGLFHFPIDECARIIISSIKDAAPTLASINHVIFCLKGESSYSVFEKALNS